MLEEERWVAKRAVAEHCSVSERTLERWQARGMPHWRISSQLVLYRLSEINRWLESQATHPPMRRRRPARSHDDRSPA